MPTTAPVIRNSGLEVPAVTVNNPVDGQTLAWDSSTNTWTNSSTSALLGLGTAALLNVGTAANQIVQRDANGDVVGQILMYTDTTNAMNSKILSQGQWGFNGTQSGMGDGVTSWDVLPRTINQGEVVTDQILSAAISVTANSYANGFISTGNSTNNYDYIMNSGTFIAITRVINPLSDLSETNFLQMNAATWLPASGTLSLSISSTATSLTLTDFTQYIPILATANTIYLQLSDSPEIIKVNNPSKNTGPNIFSMIRGQFGTAKSSHTAGATVTRIFEPTKEVGYINEINFGVDGPNPLINSVCNVVNQIKLDGTGTVLREKFDISTGAWDVDFSSLGFNPIRFMQGTCVQAFCAPVNKSAGTNYNVANAIGTISVSPFSRSVSLGSISGTLTFAACINPSGTLGVPREKQTIRIHFTKAGTLVVTFMTGGQNKFAFPTYPTGLANSDLNTAISGASNGTNFTIDFVFDEGLQRFVCEKILAGQA